MGTLLLVFLLTTGGALCFLFSDLLSEIVTVYSILGLLWQLLT